MDLKKSFSAYYTIVATSLAAIGAIALLMLTNQKELAVSQDIRVKSLLIADELRQTSDDLTRYVRTYALTGDTAWENKYWDVLAVRNGQKPRPNGRTIALRDSMKKLGFTRKELGKLIVAERHSNDLVQTERTAFNAMKGRFDDGSGAFNKTGTPDTAMARGILFDNNYLAAKAQIMGPIDDFFVLLDQRTAQDAHKHHQYSSLLLVAIFVTILIIATISTFAFIVIKNKIIKQIEELQLANKKVEENELRLMHQNEELDKKVAQRTRELKQQNNEYLCLYEEYKCLNEQLVSAKERAEESDRLKTEFINNMSHEIRTPMNGIIGFSGFLSNADLTHEKRSYYVNIIQNSGKQLLRIIDDILEISRLSTKQVKPIEREVCLNDVLQNLFSIFDLKAKENKIPLYLKKSLSDKESTVVTDDSKLIKVIGNLLDNALKFTTKGFIELSYTKNGDYLDICVEDTGIGIKPTMLASIFDRFEQEDKEYSKKLGGLGLGLAIARANAEVLGGSIGVVSIKGEGSVFTVSIPYKPVFDNLADPAPNKAGRHLPQSPDTFTTLIAEN